MGLHLGKFVHTQSGKIIMSILLGLGLSSLFRAVCKNNNCIEFHAPPLDDFKDKIYKDNGKCVKFKPVSTKCSSASNIKIIDFE
jgi:hypothetical protein